MPIYPHKLLLVYKLVVHILMTRDHIKKIPTTEMYSSTKHFS